MLSSHRSCELAFWSIAGFNNLKLLYPVHPVDPVRKIKLYFVKFCIRLIWPLFKPAAVLNPEPLNGYALSGQGHSLWRGQMGHFGFLAAHVALPK